MRVALRTQQESSTDNCGGCARLESRAHSSDVDDSARNQDRNVDHGTYPLEQFQGRRGPSNVSAGFNALRDDTVRAGRNCRLRFLNRAALMYPRTRLRAVAAYPRR